MDVAVWLRRVALLVVCLMVPAPAPALPQGGAGRLFPYQSGHRSLLTARAVEPTSSGALARRGTFLLPLIPAGTTARSLAVTPRASGRTPGASASGELRAVSANVQSLPTVTSPLRLPSC